MGRNHASVPDTPECLAGHHDRSGDCLIMPKAGALGPETYEQETAPVQATEGDYWYDGLTLRLKTRGGWRTVAGPSDTSALDPTV